MSQCRIQKASSINLKNSYYFSVSEICRLNIIKMIALLESTFSRAGNFSFVLNYHCLAFSEQRTVAERPFDSIPHIPARPLLHPFEEESHFLFDLRSQQTNKTTKE